MGLWQILLAVGLLVLALIAWAMTTKGVQTQHFTDLDQDGEPDATPHEKEAAIALFEAEQARLHPEDNLRPSDVHGENP